MFAYFSRKKLKGAYNLHQVLKMFKNITYCWVAEYGNADVSQAFQGKRNSGNEDYEILRFSGNTQGQDGFPNLRPIIY